MKPPLFDARAETAQGREPFKWVGNLLDFDVERAVSLLMLQVQFSYIVSVARRHGLCIGAASLAGGVLFHGRKPIAITPPNSVRPEAR